MMHMGNGAALKRGARAIGLRHVLLCTGAVLLQALATPAAAQKLVDEPNQDSSDIIVTAQRRQERAVDVPMSISVVTSERLDRSNVTNIFEIGKITPGVQMNFAGASSQASIRGVSSLTNGLGNESNIAIYVDGFYISDNQSTNMDLANLENIQVLKGPQGTLYGRNATGGAILITTMRPTEELSSKVRASYGRFNEVKVAGYVSGPITQNLLFMTAASYRTSDGWIPYSDPQNASHTLGHAAPQKQASVRNKLEFRPGESFSATLAYNYSYSSDPSGVLFTPFAHVPALAFPGFPFPHPPQRATRFGTASNNGGAVTAETNQVTLTAKLRTSIGTLTSYTGYDWRKYQASNDFDGSYTEVAFYNAPAQSRVFQQAADFVVDAIQGVDLVVGGLYYDDRYSYTAGGQQAYNPGRVLGSLGNRPLTTKAWAAYADAHFHLGDKLTIGVGGRYSEDHRYMSQVVRNGAGVITLPFFALDRKFTRFTPQANIRYELGPSTNVYASYSKGFRSGAFNVALAASAALSAPVQPEDISAYEIGFKTASRKLRFEIAGYYYDYKNLQVSLTIPSPLGVGTATVLSNVPKAKIYGIDGQLTFTPLDGLDITAGGAWVHGRYGTYHTARGTGLNAATDTNVPNQIQDWTGKRIARAPEFTGNLSIDYTAPLAGGSKLLFSVNAKYSTEYAISNPSVFGPLAPAAIAGKQRFLQDNYGLLDASFDWRDASGHFTVGVFGKNLTNTSYRLTYNGGAFGDYSTKAAPVTYGIRMGYDF